MAKKILIVEDDKLFREGMGAMLRGEGHEVTEASDGKKGLATALAQQPDLIITDIRMPEMDGLEMVGALREDEWGKTVPIIVLSNDETTDAINHALQSGVTVYLSKVNLDPETLHQQIVMALGS
jgi:CheY-like chemotaxis protein